MSTSNQIIVEANGSITLHDRNGAVVAVNASATDTLLAALQQQDIKRVKKIKIGDKIYAPDEAFDKKNIVAGSVEDADEFILGDGH